MGQNKIFAGLDKQFTALDMARIAILPVAYDITSTWIKGADKGPFAIIDASHALEFYDIETDFEVYRSGIHTCETRVIKAPPEEMVRIVERDVTNLISAGKFVVLLGGEHSVTIGAVKAFAEKTENFSVLQLDAHADLRDEYEGSKCNHACVAARIKEEVDSLVQVGVRSMSAREKDAVVPEKMFYAKDVIAGQTGWVDKVVDQLSDNVYVTVDLDVFDPSIMPSTGTPEPGGLSWYDVMTLLAAVAKKKNVVGFDCVELCPNEVNKAPDFLAAKLVYKFLSHIFKARGEK
jgi:N1-aminopropylagmatine ureohydrolase